VKTKGLKKRLWGQTKRRAVSSELEAVSRTSGSSFRRVKKQQQDDKTGSDRAAVGKCSRVLRKLGLVLVVAPAVLRIPHVRACLRRGTSPREPRHRDGGLLSSLSAEHLPMTTAQMGYDARACQWCETVRLYGHGPSRSCYRTI